MCVCDIGGVKRKFIGNCVKYVGMLIQFEFLCKYPRHLTSDTLTG